jgi:hypothetical protein
MGLDTPTITACAAALAFVITAIGKAAALVIWAWRQR